LYFVATAGEYVSEALSSARAAGPYVCSKALLILEKSKELCNSTREPGLQAVGPGPPDDPGVGEGVAKEGQIVVGNVCPVPGLYPDGI